MHHKGIWIKFKVIKKQFVDMRMHALENGWLSGVEKRPSPNRNLRPQDTDIRLLVIHCISLPEGQYDNHNVEDFFTNQLDIAQDPSLQSLADVQVSAHFYIRREGTVVQFVSTDDRAWHAGKSIYQGVENCNDYSIGIELQGCIAEKYTQAQYDKLVALTQVLRLYYPNIQDHIVAHSDITPERKQDPGVYFDWEYYFRQLNKEGK